MIRLRNKYFLIDANKMQKTMLAERKSRKKLSQICRLVYLISFLQRIFIRHGEHFLNISLNLSSFRFQVNHPYLVVKFKRCTKLQKQQKIQEVEKFNRSCHKKVKCFKGITSLSTLQNIPKGLKNAPALLKSLKTNLGFLCKSNLCTQLNKSPILGRK